MGKAKDQTKWKEKPKTQEVSNVENLQYQRDARIPYIFGERKRQFKESYNNPLGAYTTPDVRDKSVRANNDRIDQEHFAAIQGENAMANNWELGKRTTVAQMMQPELIKKTGGFDWNAALGAGAQMGASAITAF